MRDVNSAANKTISRRPRANRSGTHGVGGAMYRQMSAGARGDGALQHAVANLPRDHWSGPEQSGQAGEMKMSSRDLPMSSASPTRLKYLTVCMSMLRATADPITDEKHISYQIIISWNAKLDGLHITLFVVISCSSGDLAVDTYSQPADSTDAV